MKQLSFFVATLMLSFYVNASEPTRVELDIRPGMIFAGYGNVSSDENRVLYADKVCQYFGFTEAGDYANEAWVDQEGPMTILTIDEFTKKPKSIQLVPLASEWPASYSRLNCLRY